MIKGIELYKVLLKNKKSLFNAALYTDVGIARALKGNITNIYLITSSSIPKYGRMKNDNRFINTEVIKNNIQEIKTRCS